MGASSPPVRWLMIALVAALATSLVAVGFLWGSLRQERSGRVAAEEGQAAVPGRPGRPAWAGAPVTSGAGGQAGAGVPAGPMAMPDLDTARRALAHGATREERVAGLTAMAASGGKEGLDSAREALSDPDLVDFGITIIQSRSPGGVLPKEDLDRAFATFTRATEDAKRATAPGVLAALKQPRDDRFGRIVRELLSSADPDLRAIALVSLSSGVPPEVGFPILIPLLENGEYAERAHMFLVQLAEGKDLGPFPAEWARWWASRSVPTGGNAPR